MPDEKKPAAKKNPEQQVRPKTPNPVKVQKGGSSDSFSHSSKSTKPAKKTGSRPTQSNPPKPPKKSDK